MREPGRRSWTSTDLIKKRIGDELEAPIAIAGMKEINYEPIFGRHYGMLNVILKGRKERKHSVVELMEGVREDAGRILTSHGRHRLCLGEDA